MADLIIRRWLTFTDRQPAESPSLPDLVKLAVAVVVANPYAGRGYVADLSPLVRASVALGRRMGALAVETLSAQWTGEGGSGVGARPAGRGGVQSYGKAGLVGLAGEQEHANALLTTDFANPVREAIGGGRAWISSVTKRGAPGEPIDVPLAHKDALYVRSHYDAMTLRIPDAPAPDEIVLIMAFANRGRINARVGGLRHEAVEGADGLH